MGFTNSWGKLKHTSERIGTLHTLQVKERLHTALKEGHEVGDTRGHLLLACDAMVPELDLFRVVGNYVETRGGNVIVQFVFLNVPVFYLDATKKRSILASIAETDATWSFTCFSKIARMASKRWHGTVWDGRFLPAKVFLA